MLLELPGTRHVSSLNHEGKLLLVATVESTTGFGLFYTVRQDGFEDSALQGSNRSGWESFRPLDLPNEADDSSVLEHERDALCCRDGTRLLNSIYRSGPLTADAPVQLVSLDGHVVVFRQSTGGTLLVDRYVLDAMNNRLVRKLEVRFKRSRQRMCPAQQRRITASGRADSFDMLDFTDMDGNPFYAPTQEVCPGALDKLAQGDFAVVVTQTLEKDVSRWHFFALRDRLLRLVSLRGSADSLFDFGDTSSYLPDPVTGEPVYGFLPGVIVRDFDLKNDTGDALAPLSPGVAAARHDVQHEQVTQDGPQLLRDSTRVLVAAACTSGLATLSFDVAADGTLAQTVPPQLEPLREDVRTVSLPADMLDRIKAMRPNVVPPGGSVAALAQSDGEDSAGRLRVTSPGSAGAVRLGDTVSLYGTPALDGLYTVTAATDATFTVPAPSVEDGLGSWEKREEDDSGVVFDGMLTGYARNADGTLTISAPNHGLNRGDAVQIVGSTDYDGMYPIVARGNDSFVVQRRWAPAEAVDVRLLSQKRRGLTFDGKRDWLRARFPRSVVSGKGFTLEAWIKPSGAAAQQVLCLSGPRAGDSALGLRLSGDGARADLNPASASGAMSAGAGSTGAVPVATWTHLAVVSRSDQRATVLNGASHIALPAMPLDFSTGFTFETWVRFAQLTENARLFDFGNATDADRAFLTTIHAGPTGACLAFATYDGAGARSLLQTGKGAVRPGIWMHLAVTFDGARRGAIYRDGVLLQEQKDMRLPRAMTRAMHLLGKATREADGGLYAEYRDVSVWSRARSAAEIASAMQDGAHRDQRGLIGHWPLDRIVGDACAESGGGGAAKASRATLSGSRTRIDLIRDGILASRDFVEGQLVEAGELAIAAAALQARDAAKPMPADRFFAGEIAGVRLWDRPRSAAEVRAAMHLDLTGRETGLIGYWRLGGVFPVNDEPHSFDFSVNAAHAEVFGDPYSGSIELQRGTPAATAFTNADLFAVAEGGTYEESFEFCPGDDTLMPAFAASVWGRASRDAETKLAAELMSSGVTKLDDKWHRFSARFRIPQGMRLLRSFDIGQLAGDWSSMKVRRHAIRILSDTVTRSQTREASKLTRVSLGVDATTALSRLRDLELDEAGKVSRSRDVERQIELLELARKDRATLDARIAVSQAERDRLARIRDDRAAALAGARASPINYWCRVVNRETGLGLTVRDGSAKQGAGVVQTDAIGAHAQWQFVAAAGQPECYHLKVRHTGKALSNDPRHGRLLPDARGYWPLLQGDLVPGAPTQTWRVAELVAGASHYLLESQWQKGCVLHVLGPTRPPGAEVVLFKKSDEPSYQYKLEILKLANGSGDTTDEGLRAIRTAEDELDRAAKALAPVATQLAQLVAARAAGSIDSDIQALGTEKTALDEALRKLRADIAAVTRDYLATVARAKQGQPMKKLAGSDPLGLSVAGALLACDAPATRLHALESCTGDVVIRFRDVRGILRDATYDPVYDRDGQAEVWKPMRFASALRKADVDLAIASPELSSISGRITIEFWSRGGASLPRTRCKRTMSDTQARRYLADYEDIRTHYAQRPLAGAKEHQNLYGQNTDPDPGHPIVESFLLGVPGERPSAIVEIQLPDSKGYAVWRAGSGATCDTLSVPVDARLYRERWTHWAFVKDAEKGEMRIYANGRPIAGNLDGAGKPAPAQKQALAGLTSLVLDGSWDGQISDLRIWSEALDAREVEACATLAVSGNEPGLVACFPFSEGSGDVARDLTGRASPITGVADLWTPCTMPLETPGETRFTDSGDGYRLPAARFSTEQGMTLECWVKLDSLTEWARLVDFGNDGDPDNFYLAVDKGKQRFEFASHTRPGAAAPYVGQSLSTQEKSAVTGQWIHLAVVLSAAQGAIFYCNGKVAATDPQMRVPASVTRQRNYFGRSSQTNPGWKFPLAGALRSVRLWERALSAADIASSRGRWSARPGSGLVGSWLDPLQPAVNAQYANVRQLADGSKESMMLGMVATPTHAGVEILDRQRIETLDMKWIGNAQIKPTLVGYIEGAPPIPTENLTEEDDYNGATSVELVQSSDVEYSWTREQDASTGFETAALLGVHSETVAGSPFAMTSIEEIDSGFGARSNFAYHWQNASTVSSAHSLMTSDRLELRGTTEQDPAFPHLGRRFIPKNVGYALVISGLADVYVSKLRRSGRMVAYQVLPVEGVPLDVNTITFMINPAYVMAGSLDGMTGSSPTSQRFFGHVGDMRARFGSLYPASYMRLVEAYDLKSRIDEQDKRHEAYFANFNARLVDETALNRQIGNPSEGESSLSLGNTATVSAEESAESRDLEDRIEALQQTIDTIEKKSSPTQEEKTELGSARANKEELGRQLKALRDREQKARTDDSERRQKLITRQHQDVSARAHASSSYESWQRKMESLRLRAGKHNIVNTYVWDGDGGFHAEEQQFVNSVEHSVGGSIDFGAGLGGKANVAIGKVAVSLEAYANVGLTQTMSKTARGSKGFELHVDLSGVESRNITDYKDRPILPGEKVDRYRFMSFYLEGDARHWHGFYTQVVDPEWLASNDEEARALREARMAAPNKAWRVLHRVTYVERPALMGFGRDPRARAAANAEVDLQAQVGALKDEIAALQQKLDRVLDAVTPRK